VVPVDDAFGGVEELVERPSPTSHTARALARGISFAARRKSKTSGTLAIVVA